MLTKWNGEQGSYGYDINLFVNLPSETREAAWNAASIPLDDLYCFAYFGKGFWLYNDSAHYGKIYARPVLELRDTSAFVYDYVNTHGKGTYNYSIKLPDHAMTYENITHQLQSDLFHAFGFNARIEEREMPVWKLIAQPGAAGTLKTKGGPPTTIGYNAIAGFGLRNKPMKDLVRLATANLPNSMRIAFIDETKIRTNIDIVIETDMMSYEHVRKALQQYGLDLVKGKKKMKVLVISDAM